MVSSSTCRLRAHATLKHAATNSSGAVESVCRCIRKDFAITNCLPCLVHVRRKHNLVDRQLNVLDLAVYERDFVRKTVVGNNLSACHSMSVVDMTRPGIRQQV